MGSNWIKLKKAVDYGDEAKALEILRKFPEIQSKLNASAILNEDTLDTYLHLSAYYGMVELLKILLNDNNGDPNKLNKSKQTALHRVCQGTNDDVQLECLKLLLAWQNTVDKSQADVPNSESVAARSEPKPMTSKQQDQTTSDNASTVSMNINVNPKDQFENTPLHYAAMHNLLKCVKMLIGHGAYLFVENRERSTPVDIAERYGHKEIALYLESKMIFSNDDEEKENNEEFEQEISQFVDEKPHYGLKLQDLQAEKDKILVETAEMLRCNIIIAEALLKKHSWSKELLLMAWVEDSSKCFEKCGVQSINDMKFTTTATLSLQNSVCEDYEINKPVKESSSLTIESQKSPQFERLGNNLEIVPSEDKCRSKSPVKIDPTMCNICLVPFDKCDDTTTNEESNSGCYPVQVSCGHMFCRDCWRCYLTMKIEEGNVGEIVCPQLDCTTIVSHDIIERLVSKEMALKYLHFDIKAFVDLNPEIKWCPYPGCGNAVKNPRIFETNKIGDSFLHGLGDNYNSSKDYSRSVDCGAGHYFCWECLQEGHEPASCQNWKDWFQKIVEIKPEELRDTNEKEELSANYLWLVSNSKKCPNPNCMSPIQKNEGCNHVKCYKCKHEFCWICLEPWKKHSSLTGGYFQCNRYEASNKMIQKEKSLIVEAEETHNKTVELNKFVHYYTRFKNHEHSYKIEEPLLDMAKTKFEVLFSQTNSPQGTSNKSFRNSLTPAEETKIMSALCNGHTNTNLIAANSSSEHHAKRTASGDRDALVFKQDDMIPFENVDDTSTDEPETITHKHKFKSANSSFNRSLRSRSSCFRSSKKSNANSCSNVINNSTSVAAAAVAAAAAANANDKSQSHLFVEEAIKELLKARRILRCSYVYGYYLDTFGHKKFIFEFIQTEFEEYTESLSQIIARPHLKTPKHKIVRLTNLLRRKRLEFIETITRGLNSFNDTPPALKKYSRQRWKYLLKDNIQNDDEFKNAVAISLKELNPKNPWIIDKKGRHTNLLALLNDWPELEQELDSILVPSKVRNGKCARKLCNHPKAINTLSGSLCNYCSIKCMRSDRNEYLEKHKSKHSDCLFDIDNISMTKFDDRVELAVNANAKSTGELKQKMNGDVVTLLDDALSLKSLNSLGTDEASQDENETNSNVISDGKIKASNSKDKQVKDEQEHKENNSSNINESKDEENPYKRSDVALLPYNSLFISSNQLDIGIIFKNMDNICNDKMNDKISKTCNFKLKSKHK